ncbi:hypothetical protein U1Q18_037715 [Sarracenia purpurea var. burkii]
MALQEKKFINNPNDVVTEFIEGIVETYPGLQYLDGFPEVKVVLRADVSCTTYDKVAVISVRCNIGRCFSGSFFVIAQPLVTTTEKCDASIVDGVDLLAMELRLIGDDDSLLCQLGKEGCLFAIVG